jgi:hypothetical protein
VKVDPEGLGKRIASRYIIRGMRPNPRELAEQLAVPILVEENPPPAQPDLRAEYRRDPPRIILYRDPLELLSGRIHAAQRFDLLACSLEDLHIAHELFHHLEFGGAYGPLRPDEVEAAAHAFAQELCELSFRPTELSEL